MRVNDDLFRVLAQEAEFFLFLSELKYNLTQIRLSIEKDTICCVAECGFSKIQRNLK